MPEIINDGNIQQYLVKLKAFQEKAVYSGISRQLCSNIISTAVTRLGQFIQNGKENGIPEETLDIYIQAGTYALQALRCQLNNSSDVDKQHRAFLVKLIELERYREAELQCWSLFNHLKLRLNQESAEDKFNFYKPNHKLIIHGMIHVKTDTVIFQYLNFMILYLQTIYISYKYQDKIIGSEDLLSLFDIKKSFFIKTLLESKDEIRKNTFKLLCKIFTSFTKLPNFPRILKSILIFRFLQILHIANKDIFQSIPELRAYTSNWIQCVFKEILVHQASDPSKVYKYLCTDLYKFSKDCFQESPEYLKDRDLSYISSLVSDFQNVKITCNLKDSYQWNEIIENTGKQKNSTETSLVLFLDKVMTSPHSATVDMVQRVFKSLPLLNDTKFLKDLLRCLSLIVDDKTLSDTVKSQIIRELLYKFNTYFQDAKAILIRPHLSVLDQITIYVKSKLDSGEDLQFITESLDILAYITKNTGQVKRFRNISNLYYNMALKLIKMSQEDTTAILIADHLRKCIAIEEAIIQAEYVDTNVSQYCDKLQRAVTILLKYDNTSLSSNMICSFLQRTASKDSTDNISDFYYATKTKYFSVFGLLFKCLKHNQKSFVFSIFPPQLRAVVFLNLLDILASIKLIADKSDIANILLDLLKIDEDPLLYYYCYINYLSLPGLGDVAEIQLFDESDTTIFDKSCFKEYELLIMSALNFRVLTKFNNELKNSNLILDLFELFINWLSQNNEHLLMNNKMMLNLEQTLIKLMAPFFKYYNLIPYLSVIVSQYAGNRPTLLDSNIEFQLFLMFESINCYSTLGFSNILSHDLEQLSVFMKNNSSTHSRVLDTFNLKIHQIKHHLMTNNLTQAKYCLESTHSFIQSNSRQFPTSIVDYIKNEQKDYWLMIAYSKFSYTSALLRFKLGVYEETIADLRRSVRIILIMIKNLSGSTDLGYSEQQKARSTQENEILVWEANCVLRDVYCFFVQVCLHYGFSKDCEYYIKQLAKITLDLEYLPMVSLKCLYVIVLYYIFSAKVEQASQYFQRIQSLYNELLYIDKELEITHASTCVKYYQFNGIANSSKDEVKGIDSNVLKYHNKLCQDIELLEGYAERHYGRKIASAANAHSPLVLAVYNHITAQDMVKYHKIKLETENFIVSLFDYDSIRTYMSTLDFFKPNVSTVGNSSKLLSAFVMIKKLLLNAKARFSSDPVLAVLQDSAISLPSIDNQRPYYMNRAIEPAQSSIKELEMVETLISKIFDTSKLYCSNIELYNLSYIFSHSLTLLSAMSNVDKQLLTQWLFLSELPRQLPFRYERQIADYEEDTKSLIPSAKSKYFDEMRLSLDGDTLQSEIYQYLPERWNVITIDICPYTGDLLLARLAKQDSPFMVRLPLNRFSSRVVGEEYISFKNAKKEFLEIIRKSNESTKFSKTANIIDVESKKNWWRERYTLNARLEKLLKDIEFYWLGGFKGIFNQSQNFDKSSLAKFKRRFMEILEENLPSRKKIRMMEKSTILSKKRFTRAQSMPSFRSFLDSRKEHVRDKISIDDSVFEMFFALGDPLLLSETELLEDLIYFTLDVLSFHGEENAYDEIDIDQIYVDVEEALKLHYNTARNLQEYKNISQPHFIEHTVLIVGKSCQNLPWESLPCFQDASVSRMPSLDLLLQCLKTHMASGKDLTINIDKGYYVLNPSQDLTRTQILFESKFCEDLPDWSYKIGEAPTEDDMLGALTDSDLFIYIGHGGGEHYVRNSRLKRIGTKSQSCASSLLIGCSSGSLSDNGQLEPNGTVFSYLIAGAPMVLANLWDVTDKDIDKFSMSLFEHWGLFKSGQDNPNRLNICQAAAKSRSVCLLKYLNGAAPVIYGLPFKVDRVNSL